MSRPTRKVKVSPRERQLLLEFFRAIYVEDIELPTRKPPSPDKGPKLMSMAKAARTA